MKRYTLIVSFILGLTNIGSCQSIIYDLLASSPDYTDTIYSIDASFKKCDSTWVTNLEWGSCLGTHIEMWNKYIKETYDTLMTVLDSNGKALLVKSQEYWKKSNRYEDEFSEYVMYYKDTWYFGREGNFKRYYSDLAEVRSRALELKGCLEVIRDINKEKEEEK